jgi:colanic acid/amylovoran biosynthesis glycosyltransferase
MDIVVAHSTPIWLPQTQAWQFTNIEPIPNRIENHIVCKRTENLDQFSLPNIHSLDREPFLREKFNNLIRRPTNRRYEELIVRTSHKHDVRILHSHFGHVAWQNLGAVERAGLKHIVTFHGMDIFYVPRNMPEWQDRYIELFESVDLVLCEGHNMMRCVGEAGCPEEKLGLQRLGVELDSIPFKPRTWEPGNPLRVLVAGSFREKKGIPYALEALGRIKSELPLEITLVGEANDELRNIQEKDRIFRIIEEWELAPITRVCGYRPQQELFQEAYEHHIFLSPSVTAADGDIEGGMPITIIELLASGMPIVSTTNCDIPEVISSGESGLLAEERDVEGLVRHLRWLAANPGEWFDMVQRGRKHVEKEFDSLIQGKQLAEIYEKLLAS